MSDWKYDVDEVGEDADDPPDDDADRGPDDHFRGPLEPGSPTAENALFVTLGVATMLFLFGRVIVVAVG